MESDTQEGVGPNQVDGEKAASPLVLLIGALGKPVSVSLSTQPTVVFAVRDHPCSIALLALQRRESTGRNRIAPIRSGEAGKRNASPAAANEANAPGEPLR